MATAAAPPPAELAAITSAAAMYGVPLPLSLAIANQESGFQQTNSSGGVLTSSSGAQGVYQLEPGTAAELGVDGTDEKQNIIGGNKYLGELLKQFGGDQASAIDAYNAGGANVTAFGTDPSKWVVGGSTGLTARTKAQAIAYLPSVQAMTAQYAGTTPTTPAAGSFGGDLPGVLGTLGVINPLFGAAGAIATPVGKKVAGAAAGATSTVISAFFNELTAEGFTEKMTQFFVIMLLIIGGLMIIVPRGAAA